IAVAADVTSIDPHFFNLFPNNNLAEHIFDKLVLMTLLGGMGTVFGPVVGAFTIISLEHFLADRGQWVTVITGGIFVVCVLAFRRGVVGEVAAWWAKRRG
ncbi:MAG: hypothetical protein ACHQJ7_12595, partial [Vicinamibacteria bacterium]